MHYRGTERRIHTVYVTQNTEYHMRDNTCVGVRDLQSGKWLAAHLALKRTLAGGLRFYDNGIMPNAGTPQVGESLYFHSSGQDLVTSVVKEVQRPDVAIVARYPN